MADSRPLVPSGFLNLDPLLLEPLAQALFKSRQRLRECPWPVVLEGQPAVVERPGHEAEALLVADLDVPVPHPLGHGREQLLDAGLLGGRLHHAGAAGPPSPLRSCFTPATRRGFPACSPFAWN